MKANNGSTSTRSGFIYILISNNCDSIKIGGSDYPPLKRVKQINATEPYKALGKWHLADFREVKDWRSVEYHLHSIEYTSHPPI